MPKLPATEQFPMRRQEFAVYTLSLRMGTPRAPSTKDEASAREPQQRGPTFARFPRDMPTKGVPGYLGFRPGGADGAFAVGTPFDETAALSARRHMLHRPHTSGPAYGWTGQLSKFRGT
ncbi:unnamed protein product [Symbiodinium natans]|uniref:Uncharacterized protein n=1 Tax=Symbiodinium natans TaxID=878477 RepID=A0A812SI33_9DINO|nr:unnamed protein product [Symbiodinium natans]